MKQIQQIKETVLNALSASRLKSGPLREPLTPVVVVLNALSASRLKSVDGVLVLCGCELIQVLNALSASRLKSVAGLVVLMVLRIVPCSTPYRHHG